MPFFCRILVPRDSQISTKSHQAIGRYYYMHTSTAQSAYFKAFTPRLHIQSFSPLRERYTTLLIFHEWLGGYCYYLTCCFYYTSVTVAVCMCFAGRLSVLLLFDVLTINGYGAQVRLFDSLPASFSRTVLFSFHSLIKPPTLGTNQVNIIVVSSFNVFIIICRSWKL